MLEAGQLAQRLSGLSKRLHRRFNGRPELAGIDQAIEEIQEQLDKLHGTDTASREKLAARGLKAGAATEKAHDPRPEKPEQDDPTPPVEETPEGEPRGLQSLDAELQEDGEEPLLPPAGQPTEGLKPPRKPVPLAELSYEDLKELAGRHGVQSYRVKRENIQKGLEKKGITEG